MPDHPDFLDVVRDYGRELAELALPPDDIAPLSDPSDPIDEEILDFLAGHPCPAD